MTEIKDLKTEDFGEDAKTEISLVESDEERSTSNHEVAPHSLIPSPAISSPPEKRFFCQFCSLSTKTQRELRDHEKTHTGEKPYKCEFCEYACIRPFDLVTHRRNHTGEKPYQCQYCEYRCSRKSYLKVHETHHLAKMSDDAPGKRDAEIRCEICGETFTVRRHFVRHKKQHLGQVFRCPHCPYTAVFKHYMTRHIDKHFNGKPQYGAKDLQCRYCAFRCSRSDYLKNHERKHLECPGSIGKIRLGSVKLSIDQRLPELEKLDKKSPRAIKSAASILSLASKSNEIMDVTVSSSDPRSGRVLDMVPTSVDSEKTTHFALSNQSTSHKPPSSPTSSGSLVNVTSPDPAVSEGRNSMDDEVDFGDDLGVGSDRDEDDDKGPRNTFKYSSKTVEKAVSAEEQSTSQVTRNPVRYIAKETDVVAVSQRKRRFQDSFEDEDEGLYFQFEEETWADLVLKPRRKPKKKQYQTVFPQR